MKNSKRLQRMDRNKVKVPNVQLTSLMDVFIVMVIYLLMNQTIGIDVAPPKAIKLPDSVAETLPKQTLMMLVSNTDVVLQGEPIVKIADILDSKEDNIEAVRARMVQIKQSIIGINDEALANSTEVTIMADRGVPFRVLKKLMSTSGNAGFNKISLAVNKKEKQN